MKDIREERDPAILLKTEYKALLQVAGRNERDYAIVMLFPQSGLRVSELINLRLNDVGFESREITVRQGEGAKGQGSALFGQALEALKTREVSPEYDNVFLARNKTSMDQRTAIGSRSTTKRRASGKGRRFRAGKSVHKKERPENAADKDHCAKPGHIIPAQGGLLVSWQTQRVSQQMQLR